MATNGDHTVLDGHDRGIKKKQLRISHACRPCRVRKTRCDGKTPVCVACETRGVSRSCDYSWVPQRRRISNQVRSPSVSVDEPAEASSPQIIRPTEGVIPGHQEVQPWPFTPSDGLATLAPPDDTTSWYGASSSVAFLRDVLTNESRHGTLQTPTRAITENQQSESTLYRRSDAVDSTLVLPKLSTANQFLKCYWEFVHPLWPVLHKPTFQRQYDRLWDPDVSLPREDESVFITTLNIVFALGCKFSSLIAPAQIKSVSDTFYQRAQQQISISELLDSKSIAIVQMLLLTGVYLQSTQHATRCWNTVGLAIRIGQSLGLHLEQHANRDQLSQDTCDTRRRIWHTCVSLDRVLAMTFGRPMMTSKSSILLPSIGIEESKRRQDGGRANESFSSLGLFVYSCKLFDILEDVLNLSLSELDGIPQNEGQARLVTAVMNINRRLDLFQDKLPRFLRIPSNYEQATQSNDITLQQQVLHCRQVSPVLQKLPFYQSDECSFLLVRLLLLRPLLMTMMIPSRNGAYCPVDSQSRLDSGVLRDSCCLCVETACDLINIIHENLSTPYRSSDWHVVYFTFSAAIVLLAAHKCGIVDLNEQSSASSLSWSSCVAILEQLDGQVESWARVLKVLKAIKGRMSDPAEQAETLPSGLSCPSPQSNVNIQDYEFEQFDDFFGANSISEALFSGPLTNLDWLEFPQT